MNYLNILNRLKFELEPLDFECYPFKIGWYNSVVDERFKLNEYHDDTFAVLVLNTPSMFEKLFLKYLFENFKQTPDNLDKLNDPIDECMNVTFDKIKQNLEKEFQQEDSVANYEIELVRDYDLVPGSRRAKMVMQTCAHISSAAFYYDKKFLQEAKINGKLNLDENMQEKNLMGVCLHPVYGGWFAVRCVFIFKNLLVNDNETNLKKKEPIESFNGDTNRILDLLFKFNYNWKDWSYRSTIKVKSTYSEIQKEYFLTEPKDRKKLLKKWITFPDVNALCISYSTPNSKEYSNFYKNYLIQNFFIV